MSSQICDGGLMIAGVGTKVLNCGPQPHRTAIA
ncbi:hypothetical protein A2U01_0111909, partial [Trifolium medium]|nr:hypothetical protein [Trifolium medium]